MPPAFELMGFSADGTMATASGADGLVTVSLPDGEPAGATIRTGDPPTWAEPDPARGRLYGWAENQTMSSYDLVEGVPLVEPTPSSMRLSAMTTSADGTRLIARDRAVQRVDVDRSSRFAVPGAAPRPYDSEPTALSADGTTMLTWPGYTPERLFTVTDMLSGAVLLEHRMAGPDGFHAAALAPDGSAVYTLHDSGRLMRTSIPDGDEELVGSFPTWDTSLAPGRLVMSPTGAALMISDVDTRLMDADGVVRVVSVPAFGADFLPDGSTAILTDCNGGIVWQLDMVTAAVTEATSVEGCPSGVDVSPDGSRALLGIDGPDGRHRIGIYSVLDWTSMGQIVTDGSFTLRFEDAGEGRAAVTVSDAGVGRWNVDPSSWSALACSVAGRNLSEAEWAALLGDRPYHETCAGQSIPATGAKDGDHGMPTATLLPAATPVTSPTPCSADFGRCWLAPASYRFDAFEPPLGMTLDGAWYLDSASPDLLAFVRYRSDSITEAMEIARDVVEVLEADGTATTIEPTIGAFVGWLQGRAGLTIGAESATTLGGLPAVMVDVAATQETSLFRYPETDAEYGLVPGQVIRFVVAESGGHRFHVAVEGPAGDIDAMWADVQPLVDSIAFG
jgi:DNA-binding beta-propeller fold protein YncE